MDREDAVFLIVGASTGIGAATARQAVEAGFRVVLAARSEDKLHSLVEELGGAQHALAVRCDVTEWSHHEALVARTLETFGRIDVAFANAGIGHTRGFEAGDPEDAKQMVLTNVYGVYATIRATAAALRESQGHLVLTSSIAGRRALKGSLYSATKFAVTGIGEAARQDFNETGDRVTLIEPGMVATPRFSHDLGATLKAQDVARAVMFAIAQPPHVDINEIVIRPTAQNT